MQTLQTRLTLVGSEGLDISSLHQFCQYQIISLDLQWCAQLTTLFTLLAILGPRHTTWKKSTAQSTDRVISLFILTHFLEFLNFLD